jgi:hypothetical protein
MTIITRISLLRLLGLLTAVLLVAGCGQDWASDKSPHDRGYDLD